MQGPKCLRVLYRVGWSGLLGGRNSIPGKVKKIFIFVTTPHTGCRACRNSCLLGNGEIFLEVIRLDLTLNHAYPEE